MSARRKLKRVVGAVQLLGWILFGVSCAKHDTGVPFRTVLGLIEVICPPEITVGDCAARVKAMLPPEPESADAGHE